MRCIQDPSSIAITSDYIAMCVQVCKTRCIDYVVAPAEADIQVGRRPDETIVLCRDSDEIAYGNKFVVIIDSYTKEEYRLIDLLHPLTDEIKEKTNTYCTIIIACFLYECFITGLRGAKDVISQSLPLESPGLGVLTSLLLWQSLITPQPTNSIPTS